MNRRQLLALIPAAARGQSQAMRRGRELVDQVLAALGGEKFLAMQDRTESGRMYSFYREQLRGLAKATLYTRYLTPPGGPAGGKMYLRERQSFYRDPKKEDYAILFDETKGWSITYRGAAPLPEETTARFHDTTLRNIFYLLRQRLREPEMIIEYNGREIIDNVPVDRVTFTDSANTSVAAEFHTSTHLPVRQVFYRRDPVTRERREEVTRFDKYRDVGGVMWPFTLQRERDGERIFQLYSESVKINNDLTDTLFTLPEDMKVLPPPR
ncbi:MAG: hypothetical protein IT164_17535 [Bryobacterales bacterium]|nr:hypothetical protein [Bryobacterales bacterium]